ncbi:MAG TPA: hypothetical protein VLV54_17640 [Thermoanaerobaculia bacterium]|nr:hypothetical protein [Thermoanaerobaculia bacterium]
MKLVATRQLARYPTDLTPVAGGVVVLTSDQNATFLEAFDADLEPLWTKRLEASALALVALDGMPWVIDSGGAWAFGDEGDCMARVAVGPREGMCLSAFASVGDGFVFAWEHGSGMPMRPPILQRVSFEGVERWSATLPVKPRPTDPGAPETWFSPSPDLTVSGDALLACFSNMDRTGIGFGSVVSLTDGALRFTTKSGPISEVAALGEGEFLAGYQGYGAFETLRYDRNGHELERWGSHGYYVIGGEVRVIEMKNVLPSKMHLVQLLPGGEVTKGAWLDGYYTSRPFLGTDGTIYFFRDGELSAARDLSIDKRLRLTAPDASLHSTRIVGSEQGLYFAYTQRSAGTSTRLVRMGLK